MNVLEGSAVVEPRLKTGPPAANKRLEYFTDTDVIADLLHKTQEFTDDAFNDLCDSLGGRAARLVLRAKAIGGDVRALDLYLKIVREDQERKRQHRAPMRQLHASAFDQAGRVDRTTPVVDTTATNIAAATDATADPTTTIVDPTAE